MELSEAKRLVSARDEFIGNAKKEAESIRRTAEEKARALVDQQEIVRIARTRSSELMANAENKSRELRHVASDYVDDILRRSEESLAAALNEVRGSPQPVPHRHGYAGRAERPAEIIGNYFVITQDIDILAPIFTDGRQIFVLLWPKVRSTAPERTFSVQKFIEKPLAISWGAKYNISTCVGQSGE